MKLQQRALRIPSAGVGLIGIVDVPERPLVRGLLVLPDSTQYRAGSHRQFTLLSRLLAGRGIAVMRFDRRGWGDSEGDGAAGGSAAGAEDIAAAMKEFFIHVPEMKEAVILAPGDVAPLAIHYAAGDPRVTGLALLDPVLSPALAAASDTVSAAVSAAVSAPPPARPGARQAAWRLFRRAARTPERGAAAAGVQGASGMAAIPFGGPVLLVAAGADAWSAATAPAGDAAGSTCALEQQGPYRRRVRIAGCADVGGNAWREALASACASWLSSW